MDDPTFSEELAKHSAPICLPASELARLRKIEAAARRVYDWVHNDPSSQAARLRRSLRSPREPLVLLLYGLRKSLETINGGTQT